MAEKKSVISQLQSVSEDALEKIASSAATRSALQSAMQLKDRGQRILTGFESIETRLTLIEKRLSVLEEQVKKRPPSRTRSAAGKSGASTSKSRSSTAGKAKASS